MQDTKLTLQQINRIIEPARRAPLSQVYEACLKDNSGSTLRTMRKIDYLKIKELEQLYYDNLSASNCPIDIEWELITEIDDDSIKTTALNAFVQKFATSATAEAKSYMEKASELFEILAVEATIHVDWVKAMQENTMYSYRHFISQHPNSSYHREAESSFRTLKIDLLKAMKDNPCDYSREYVYSFIDSGIFSYDELVVENHLLTDEAYNQILRYPTSSSQIDNLPYMAFEKPISRAGNVDVIFLGAPGSGGKTCLMASLMTLLNQKDFVLRNGNGGEAYAKYLVNIINNDFLPPKTDSYYVQVVDTDLFIGNHTHGVSFIEFAGEQYRDMVSIEDCFASDNLGPTLSSLLGNNNPKILFWAIDLTNNYELCIDDGSFTSIHQDDMFRVVAARLQKDSSFCNKIMGIHVVVTKSDRWERRYAVEDVINKYVYREGLSILNTICHDLRIMGNQNNTVDIIPFSIGKFMIGGTYKFDNTDAKRILEIIREDISDYHKTNRTISSMTSKQIEAIRLGKVSLQQLLEMCLNGDSMITIDNLRVIGYPKIKQLEELYYREMLSPSGSGQFQSIEAEWKMLKSLPFDGQKETLIQKFIQKLYLENTEYARSFRKKVEAYWDELLEENKLQGYIRVYNEESDT